MRTEEKTRTIYRDSVNGRFIKGPRPSSVPGQPRCPTACVRAVIHAPPTTTLPTLP